MAKKEVKKEYSRAAYAAANEVIKTLRKYKNNLTKDEISVIRGQALAGDVEGASNGLKVLLKRRGIVV